MREIKFRAWDGESGKMSSPFQMEELKFGYLKEIDNSIIDVELVLMQYIGRKDKNGKEIYEGDIVKNPCYEVRDDGSIPDGIIDVVKFEKCCFWNGRENSEVIGNIYENPKLL